MFDFENACDALKTGVSGFKTKFSAVSGKIRAAAQGWPYWAPAIVVAAIAGHCV